MNIVHGAKDVVNAVLSHQGIKGISFVGSQPIAEYVYETAANKRIQALAGAKNHTIVMLDADLDRAADEIVKPPLVQLENVAWNAEWWLR